MSKAIYGLGQIWWTSE